MGWHHLGFKPLGFSEIEPFPSAVLAHHYPDVPNFGDMTKHKEWTLNERLDILVGGTPCQSWSVAGKREGSSDSRGQLTYTFLEIVKERQPKWVVWENVPGILSAEGGDAFKLFLDTLLDLGYIINCDILDAQFFGVAQRRRRVFLACQRANDLMLSKTSISSVTGTILFAEILQSILDDLLAGSQKGRKTSGSNPENVSVGLKRKITPFLRHGVEPLNQWLTNCTDAYLKLAEEQGYLASSHGDTIKTTTPISTEEATELLGFTEGIQDQKWCLNTSLLLKKCLVDLFKTANGYTTLTTSKAITARKIYTYVEMLNIIARYIIHSEPSCPNYLKAALSVSTALQKGILYARQPNEEILSDPWLLGRRNYILRETERTSNAFLNFPDLCPSKILSIGTSLRRDTPPRRKTGEEAADSVGIRSEGCYGIDEECNVGDNHFGPLLRGGQGGTRQAVAFQQNTRDEVRLIGGEGLLAGALAAQAGMKQTNYICEPSIMAHGQANAEIRSDGDPPSLTCNHETQIVAFHVNAQVDQMNFDPFTTASRKRSQNAGVAYTPLLARSLTARHDSSACVDRGMDVVAFQQNASGDIFTNEMAGTDGTSQNASGRNAQLVSIAYENHAQDSRVKEIDVAGLHAKAGTGGGNLPLCQVPPSMQVRRLTPEECEILQGFPVGYTDIKLKGKPTPDGPRYKALGNSMAVPVMRWIGSRIQEALEK